MRVPDALIGPDGSANGVRWVTACVLILAILAVGALLFVSSYRAANLWATPDGVEYAIGAERLVSLGHYTIEVAGTEYPPRYPPFFSTVILAPFYLLLGTSNLGVVIYPVLLAGLLCAWLAFRLGCRSAGVWGGLFAAAAIAVQPMFLLWGRQVMTDVPFAALTILLAYAFTVIQSRRVVSWPDLLLCGIGVGAASALRPVGLALATPFFVVGLFRTNSMARGVANVTALLIPIGLCLFVILGYNAVAFGHPLRNGYHFWVSVPYDYPSVLFSASYVPANIRAFLRPGFGLPALVAIVVALPFLLLWPGCKAKGAWSVPCALGLFIVLGPLAISLFHMAYPFAEGRFHLPMVSLMLILAACLWGRLLRSLNVRWAVLLAVLLCVGAVVYRMKSPPVPLSNMIAAENIRSFTPADATIVTTGQLVYLEPLVIRDTKRRLIPLSRAYEYAGKIVAKEKVEDPDPAPTFYGDHMCPGLLAGGARYAVEVVVSEQPDMLEAVAAEVPLYLDLSGMSEVDKPTITRLKELFAFEEVAPRLYRLVPLRREAQEQS